MSELVLWFACVIPVICLSVVTLGVCLFSWRVISRTESAHRDMLKSVLILAQSPTAPQLAGMMESSDAQAAKIEAERANGGAMRIRRQAQ